MSQLLFLAFDNLVVGSAGETIDDKVERCNNGDGNATYDINQLSIGHPKGQKYLSQHWNGNKIV